MVKPTGLLTIHLPQFAAAIYSRQVENAIYPSDTAIGRDLAGAFKTACHKEYPPGFSNALAAAVCEQIKKSLHSRSVAFYVQLEPALTDWIQEVAFACATSRTAFGFLRDYQGS